MVCFKGEKYILWLSVFLLMCSVMFFAVSQAFTQEAGTFEHAPLNPAFVQHMQKVRLYGAQNLTADGHALGYIPSPVDMSYLAGLAAARISMYAAPAPPTSYDLRTTGKLTAVRDQGSCGDCWAFGTMSSLESNLLPGETWDFSENNLKNTSGFLWGSCAGGNYLMSTAYLSRWSGPVNESDDPYNATSNISPSGLTIQKHIQEVLFVPDRISSTDNNNIKQAIMTYGAVGTTMYMEYPSANYYNATNYAYYYDGTGSFLSDHAVAIVGWDDNYSSSKFSKTPPGNGAFIIRNSWGTAWGESGYFYISYYDTNLAKIVAGASSETTVFNGAQSTTNYSRIYQYDPLGMTNSYGDSSGTIDTAWLANIFTAAASEQLTAVSFYALAPNTTYSVYIYKNSASGPTSGTLTGGSTSGTIVSAGYHTITLSTPVALTSGQKFSVVVRLTTPGWYYPAAAEDPEPGYSSPTASAGQSYLSLDGTSWTDTTTIAANTNVCLKAFTTIVAPTVTTTAVTGVTSSGAASGGNVISDGGATVTARGVCWSTTANPTTADTCTSNGTGTGTFISSITGLTPVATYHVRAYATNSIGTSYGGDVQFSSIANLPAVTTTTPTGITHVAAASGGNVTSDGGASVTARGVCWSTSVNPTTSNTCTNDGTGPGSFISSITGLTPVTTYHVRAYATNSAGTGYGGDASFTTIPAPVVPTVTTTAITGITMTAAAGGGNVTSDGGMSVTVKGVCWGISINPVVGGTCTSNGTGTGSFISSISGLIANTAYHVRAYATNSVGTGYGSDVQFTTLAAPIAPTITTSAITGITTITASGGGNISSDGGASVTARGVCWSTSANPGVGGTCTSDGTGTGSFTSSITGLTTNIHYHVRAYATNSVGTSYGSDSIFTTGLRPNAPHLNPVQ